MVREIAEEIAKAAQQILGDQFECTVNEKRGNNGIVEMQITVKKAEIRIAPSIYIEKMYEDMDGEIDDVAHKVAEIAEQQFEHGMPEVDTESFMDPDFIKKNAVVTLVNGERNRVDDIVSRDYMDLKALVRIRCMEAGSFLVKKELLERTGITEDELFEAAMQNTKADFESIGMADCLQQMGVGGIDASGDSNIMTIVSTKNRAWGGSCLLYADLFAEIADKNGSDLYILPSSVHEVIAVPASSGADPEMLLNMVKEVNATQLAPDEFLADSVYFYSREDGQIRKVA